MPEIKIPATLESIPKAMDFLRKNLGEEQKINGQYMELAVEELLVNVSSYAYQEERYRQHPNVDFLTLGCRWVNMDGQDLFCVWLRDWGAPFDPFRAKTPNLDLGVDERSIGGLGVHLIKHVSKHYIYSGSDGSNTVELYFQAV